MKYFYYSVRVQLLGGYSYNNGVFASEDGFFKPLNVIKHWEETTEDNVLKVVILHSVEISKEEFEKLLAYYS